MVRCLSMLALLCSISIRTAQLIAPIGIVGHSRGGPAPGEWLGLPSRPIAPRDVNLLFHCIRVHADRMVSRFGIVNQLVDLHAQRVTLMRWLANGGRDPGGEEAAGRQ
jgi:hypothetical protein